MRFLVYTPKPYTHRSGGVRALHVLAKALTDRGHQVGTCSIGQTRTPDPDPYGIPDGSTWARDHPDDTIHIYPEIVDPRHMIRGRVVRWLLNIERYTATKDELQVVWSPHLKPGLERLTVDIIEPDLFYPKNSAGTGWLWYGGKGARYADNVPTGAVQITHRWPATRPEVADTLRSADRLMCFDAYSAISIESAICGTPVLVPHSVPCTRRPDPYFSDAGIAYGEAALERAVRTVSEAAAQYDETRLLMGRTVDRFVQMCAERWAEL